MAASEFFIIYIYDEEGFYFLEQAHFRKFVILKFAFEMCFVCKYA